MSTEQYSRTEGSVKTAYCPRCARRLITFAPEHRGDVRRECVEGHFREVIVLVRRAVALSVEAALEPVAEPGAEARKLMHTSNLGDEFLIAHRIATVEIPCPGCDHVTTVTVKPPREGVS